MNNLNDQTPADVPTLVQTQLKASALRDRLAAAAGLLHSLKSPPKEASLVFARGRDIPVEAVPVGAGITLGRGTDCSISLDQGGHISRRHFGVRPESGAWLLEDFGSRNGTMVDGLDGRVTRRFLRDGDVIFAGDLIFLFINPVG